MIALQLKQTEYVWSWNDESSKSNKNGPWLKWSCWSWKRLCRRRLVQNRSVRNIYSGVSGVKLRPTIVTMSPVAVTTSVRTFYLCPQAALLALTRRLLCIYFRVHQLSPIIRNQLLKRLMLLTWNRIWTWDQETPSRSNVCLWIKTKLCPSPSSKCKCAKSSSGAGATQVTLARAWYKVNSFWND